MPVPGDYDGDARYDLTVVRPGQPLTWYIELSNGGQLVTGFGRPDDIPVPAKHP